MYVLTYLRIVNNKYLLHMRIESHVKAIRSLQIKQDVSSEMIAKCKLELV